MSEQRKIIFWAWKFFAFFIKQMSLIFILSKKCFFWQGIPRPLFRNNLSQNIDSLVNSCLMQPSSILVEIAIKTIESINFSSSSFLHLGQTTGHIVVDYTIVCTTQILLNGLKMTPSYYCSKWNKISSFPIKKASKFHFAFHKKRNIHAMDI